MKEIDNYSYACGVMDCFNEMLRADVKKIALSHPCNTLAKRDEFVEYAKVLCEKYGTQYYLENSGFVTDLFPMHMNQNKYNIVFYKQEQYLEEYLKLKAKKLVLLRVGQYNAKKRKELAKQFGKLLSYTDEAIEMFIRENNEKEVVEKS